MMNMRNEEGRGVSAFFYEPLIAFVFFFFGKTGAHWVGILYNLIHHQEKRRGRGRDGERERERERSHFYRYVLHFPPPHSSVAVLLACCLCAFPERGDEAKEQRGQGSRTGDAVPGILRVWLGLVRSMTGEERCNT